MKRILLLPLLLVSSFGYGQEPVIDWQKSLGGSGYDYAYSVQQTFDGGYIVAGESNLSGGDVTGNHGMRDYWVVKLGSSGNITWQKSLGGSQYDYATSIQQTMDGGYIVVGPSASNDGDVTGNHGSIDYWVVKLDQSGNITWQKSLGGSDDEYATSVIQTVDEGFIVTGTSRSNDGDVTGNHGEQDFWVVKLDASGDIQWQKSLGGSEDDIPQSIEQTTGGGYIVAGYSRSTDGDVSGNDGDWDYWIVKLDASGNISWQKSLGGSGVDRANSIKQTTDGGYIIAGISDSNDGDITGNQGDADSWLVKFDAAGNLSWQKSLGGSSADSGVSVQQSTDGGYVVAGWSYSSNGDITGNNGGVDFWVVKTDSVGNIIWQKSLGGSGNDGSGSIQQTTDEGYIVVGGSASSDGDVTENNGSTDYWVVKLSPETSSIDENKTIKFNVYPNPTAETFTMYSDKLIISSFKIIDVQGKVVLTGKMKGKEHTIDISFLSKGAYSVVFDNSVLPVLSVIKE